MLLLVWLDAEYLWKMLPFYLAHDVIGNIWIICTESIGIIKQLISYWNVRKISLLLPPVYKVMYLV